MPTGSFFEGVDELKELVGSGTLTGKVEFDQVYAWNQHEGRWINFMGHLGPKVMTRGSPQFLAGPLMDLSETMLQTIADHVLVDGPDVGMVQAMEDLAAASAAAAPIEVGVLKGSAHPSVEDDGVVVWDEPPLFERQAEEQLAAEHKGEPWGE
jgi:hypothetical protein